MAFTKPENTKTPPTIHRQSVNIKGISPFINSKVACYKKKYKCTVFILMYKNFAAKLAEK